MQNQQQLTATQQVQGIVQQLNSSLLRKEVLTEQLDETNKQIVSMRNAIAGVELGQALQRDVTAEQAAMAVVPPAIPLPIGPTQ